MHLEPVLIALSLMLGATAIGVVLFNRLGLGSVLGFIFAGIIIGPHTPGPVAAHNVQELQTVAEIGVALFLFTIGLEMRPERIWSMRRLLFGMGSGQMLITAAVLTAYITFFFGLPWESAVILGFGLAMSSTAIIMTTLTERGEMSSQHGQNTFAVLMAQDLWVVPVMALVPILATKAAQEATIPAWQQGLLVVGVLAGIFVVGRYVLPAALGHCANRRRMDAFAIVLFLALIVAALAAERAGLSMTLATFVMGMLLSASDYRFQVEATVAPFKETLMGLFFLAVGMSIDVGAFAREWSSLLIHVPVVMLVKTAILIALVLAFGGGRATAIRTGFTLSQVGEISFVLFASAAAAGLLTDSSLTLAMLTVAMTMILTPLMIKAGDRLAGRVRAAPSGAEAVPDADLDGHVVIVGYDVAGQLISMMLDRAHIPYLAFDRNIDTVRRCKQAGRNVHFGNMDELNTQQAAGIGKAAAAYITMRDLERAKGLAITLHNLYPMIDVYVLVGSLDDQDELVAKGIKHAGTGYIESTLVRGSTLLKDLGVPEGDVGELIKRFQHDDYALIRATFTETAKTEGTEAGAPRVAE